MLDPQRFKIVDCLTTMRETMAKRRFNAAYEQEFFEEWEELAEEETKGNITEFIERKVNEAILIKEHLGSVKYATLLAKAKEEK